jgi:integrase
VPRSVHAAIHFLLRAGRSEAGGDDTHLPQDDGDVAGRRRPDGAREIADHLGHAQVSVTQDTYFGRQQASPKVADALEIISSNQVSSR